MGTETLRPNSEVQDSNLVANDETDHDEDPDVSTDTVNATGNDVQTKWSGGFPTPTGSPKVGADLQEFRAGVEPFDLGQTGTPTARISLLEGGFLVRAGPFVDVTEYTVLSLTWDAAEIQVPDGSLVQMQVIAVQSGGGASEKNSVNIGHMEWNANVEADIFNETVNIKQVAAATPNIVQIKPSTENIVQLVSETVER